MASFTKRAGIKSRFRLDTSAPGFSEPGCEVSRNFAKQAAAPAFTAAIFAFTHSFFRHPTNLRGN
jgi:hypothetical protein